MQERMAKHEIDHSYAFICGSFYNCKMPFLVSSSFFLCVSPRLGGNLKEDVHRYRNIFTLIKILDKNADRASYKVTIVFL
jgi:hypothetical protein